MLDLAPILAFLDQRHHALAGQLRTFVSGRVAPLPEPVDDGAARAQARAVLGRFGEGGLARLAVPSEWGGESETVDLRSLCLAREALAWASPLADAVFALQALGSMPITLGGSDAQRRRYLPEVAAGRAMAGFAMTEPEAGSDVGALQTVARRTAGGFVLDGRKVYISNAGIADFYVVFAKFDPAAGRRGIAAFVVPATSPGLRCERPLLLSAPHPLGELAFDSCAVPEDALLAEAGAGFALGMQTLDRLRPTVAAAACGMAARALDEALAHARSRRQFGRSLAEFQLIQDKLARMRTELDAARLLTYRAAYAADGGAERIALEAAIAKSFATEAAQRIVDEAVQILGGAGCLAEHPVDRLYRSVRALRIYEGTTEIQRLVIARELLREPGSGS